MAETTQDLIATRGAQMFPQLTDEELAEVYPYEDWVLAHSHVGFVPDGEIETDLFAGVDVGAEARS